MNKRYLHHVWTRLRPVSHWYFLAAFLVFGTIFIMSYRQNNVGMIELREKVFIADEEKGDIEKALRDLRQYVYSHMNTSLVSSDIAIKPPIQLKHHYERLVAQEKERVDAANASLTEQANAICRQRFPSTNNVTGLAPCIQGYLSENGVKERDIPKELYQFDFVSPRWSPDVAGWSLVATVLFGFLFVLRFGLERWLRHEIHDHS